jgi:hypothetical protein
VRKTQAWSESRQKLSNERVVGKDIGTPRAGA